MLNQIYNLSCFDLFAKLAKNNCKVDLILTDPPYNISQKNNFKTMGREGFDWNWDYDFDQISWLKPAVELLNENGSIIIFNSIQNFYFLKKELESLGCVFKNILRWEKKNPMPRNTQRRYVTDCEYMFYFVKSKKSKWTFNIINKNEKYLKPCFISSVSPGLPRIHPCQKNLTIIEQILLIHSNDNDIILDPFSGSGTISYAAFKNNRNFIASEINNDYYQKSIQLLEKLKK